MKAAVYVRKSVTTERGESILSQKKLCAQYLKERLGFMDNDIIYYADEGFSGGTFGEVR
ncbi:MAG: recombinase family protein [Clostridiales bacterium]|nr:recombinase family protein [Clostridiales bacterium]